jgi:hypothetical protein
MWITLQVQVPTHAMALCNTQRVKADTGLKTGYRLRSFRVVGILVALA